MSGVCNYSDKDGQTFCEIYFSNIEFHYAAKFGEQVKTWMYAVGCTDAHVDIQWAFSETTTRHLLDLSAAYSNRSLAIFLGAGVSADIGLPSWKDLISRMIDVVSRRTVTFPATKLERLSTLTLVEQARWLRRDLGENFNEAVRQALYQDIYKNGKKESRILKNISQMNLLRAVCTYNYDDFLENTAVQNFKTIASATEGYGIDEIPVYHPHGFLPYTGEPRGELILSENDYHELFNTPNHWANVLQLSLLRECTCLLIGISATDPNLRRILDIIKDSKAGHTYIIKKMDKVSLTEDENLNSWISSKEFDSEHYKDIHLRTIWINSYQEIPVLLNQLRSAQ